LFGLVILAVEKFCEGGHIERSSYRVEKTAKPVPKENNKMKKITEKYFKQKEEEFAKYEDEVKQKLRKNEELKLK
jgi:hypothetical protein